MTETVEDEEPEVAGVVLDNGTGYIKAGFSGDDAPRCVFNNIVGYPAYKPIMLGMGTKEAYCGNEIDKMRGILKLDNPIRNGVIINWNMMEKIWYHTFNHELRINPEDHKILVTEAPLNPKQNREKMVKILFEQFGFEGTYVNIQAVLSLYSSGRTTGCVLDSGDGVTHSVPIFEGYALPHGIKRINIGGRNITEQLSTLLTMSNVSMYNGGYEFISSASHQIVQKIKEDTCYVALNYQEEVDKCLKSDECEVEYTLPDGSVIKVNTERFAATEVLYNPILIGKESSGIHELVIDAIYKCELDIRQALFNNIILSGGNTTFTNFEQRLQNELVSTLNNNSVIKIIAPPERKYSVWIGGSILTSLSTFQELWITKKEYEEEGPRIVHRKCY